MGQPARLDSRNEYQENNAVDEMISQAHALLSSVLGESRPRPGVGQFLTEQFRYTEWCPLAQSLVGSCESSLLIATSDLPTVGEGQLPAVRSLLESLVSRGIDVRYLYSSRALESQDRLRHAQDMLHAEVRVRVTTTELYNMIVVDSGTALLWGSHGRPAEQALVVRARALARNLSELFSIAWGSSCDLSVFLDLQERTGRTMEFIAEVLRPLAQGVKDDIAARSLGVSVRTYRRYVAELMGCLCADSRFQAGVRAAKLGLIDGAAVN